MLDAAPKVLQKRLHLKVAGEAIARGIEKREPRIIRPRRWTVLSVLRGIINPLSDAQMERDAKMRSVVEELDGRGGQEQKTTA